MAFRVYVMPITGSGTLSDPRRAKYAQTDLAGCNLITMDSGAEGACLVAADVTPAQHTTVSAHADVAAAPVDLSQQVGSSLSVVQGILEAMNIPAGWVTGTMTYQTILRSVAALFQFNQAYMAAGGTSLFQASITLNSTFSQLPAGVRTLLVSTATSLGYSTAQLSGASTIRACLKAMADQWKAVDSLILGPAVF